MKIKALIKKLNPKVNIPEYKTTGSSGLDLEAFIEQDIIIKSKETALIPTGISVAIPENFEKTSSGFGTQHTTKERGGAKGQSRTYPGIPRFPTLEFPETQCFGQEQKQRGQPREQRKRIGRGAFYLKSGFGKNGDEAVREN